MAITTIPLYASPPSTQINTHASYDFDVNAKASSPACKPSVGGLSCIFSANNCVKYSSFTSCSSDEELSSSFGYSSCKLKRDISISPHARVWDKCGDYGAQRTGAKSLFNGFVMDALASSFEARSLSSSAIVDEMTFDMDDEFVDCGVEMYAKDLLTGAQLRHKIFYEELVIKAFYEAERAHRGQMRASGDPYLQHCVETAMLLAMIGANSTVVAAGLLHDTIDDSFITYDYIFTMFGARVADLVEGVSKLSQLSELARQNNTANKSIEADRLHTMFLAMADARAVLIKLADRLHNMMTLDALQLVKKRQRFAKETLEVFVPLANRLGISTWKEQLENICFKHLHPEQHEVLSSKLVESFDEEMITSAIQKVKQALKDQAISYHFVSGRHKSLYGIYCKMLKKKLPVDEIHDIHGLRLIVGNVEDCYKALEVVHRLWSQVPEKFKDYISHPKFNGYQSLHTVVVDDNMVPLEVQIRTKDMHLQAEFGFAAHWRYKEGDCKHSSYIMQMVEWARWVVTWQCEAMSRDHSAMGISDSMKPACTFPTHADDCPYCYKPQCEQEGPVFVILIANDKMSVQEFPANSTMIDLMERAGQGSSRWIPYGFSVKEELRPRLNQRPVTDLKCKLAMGDVVELTPALPNESLTGYREEIQRMYNKGLTVPTKSSACH